MATIFKCIFLNENAWISIKISLKFVPKGPMNKIPALVQIMAWGRSGDKLLSEPMMVSLLMHTCVTWPQCVNAPFALNQWYHLTALIHDATSFKIANKILWHLEACDRSIFNKTCSLFFADDKITSKPCWLVGDFNRICWRQKTLLLGCELPKLHLLLFPLWEIMI